MATKSTAQYANILDYSYFFWGVESSDLGRKKKGGQRVPTHSEAGLHTLLWVGIVKGVPR